MLLLILGGSHTVASPNSLAGQVDESVAGGLGPNFASSIARAARLEALLSMTAPPGAPTALNLVLAGGAPAGVAAWPSGLWPTG